MIVKTAFFDDYVAAAKAGNPPTTPTAARSYSVKGYSLHVETNLSENAKALRVMERLEGADVRYFSPNSPAKRLRGSLCIISLLHHGRLVELFCADVHGGMVVLAVYANDAVAAYQLIDQVVRAVV